ncbi:hypothetical protein [Bradyrhizobium lablabi]|uniref:hypothetical protein n=1 Tax=Bradyrhizobium lablabi TaxID=722472 RepID=UPI001BADC8CB|nr:hypothetical protein [Bradyrhizobium lablabi]MBR0695443.1 hypothetical protein [Bradyrhizobium lablabi]
MQKNFLVFAPGILLGIAVLMPTSAHAYLDPGAGTFAVQGLIAAVAGGMVALRACWQRIGDLFGRSKPSTETGAERSLPDGDA